MNHRAQALPTVNNIVSSLQDMRQAYDINQPTKWLERPKDIQGHGTGADHHYQNETDLHYGIEMSRNAERNDPTVGQGVGRFITNVVQGGYTHVPETGVDWVDKEIADRWSTYTAPENQHLTDYQMRHNWDQFEELSARRIIVDGDVSFAPLRDGRIQTFEAHRMISPYTNTAGQIRRRRFVVHGVEQNRREQITRYWVTKRENDGFGLSYSNNFSRDTRGFMAWEADEITGRNEHAFFHCFNPRRFSQTRGVPMMAAILNTAGMHADLQFANLVKAQIASYIGFTHDIPISAKDEYDPPGGDIADQTFMDPHTGEMRTRGADLSPGSSHYPTYAGEKITPFTSNVPNPEFFDHAKMLLTFVATSLDMPLILFLLDASETNFSAWRGAVDQFKMSAERFQKMHTQQFHRRVHRWQVRRWLRQSSDLRRAYEAGVDVFNHQWRFPKWRHVQPEVDVKAEVLELGNLLDSPRAVAARHNRNYDQIITETCADRVMAINCGLDAAEELNKHPYVVANPVETVTWREVMPLPLSDSQQMQLLTGDPEPAPEADVDGTAGGLKAKAAAV